MSVNSKHSAGKNDKEGKRAKRKKLEDSEELESSEEELDLTKECHPIGHYINDRAEMINQMFSVIKGNKLKAMLPPILKDCDLDLLKLQCLDQLLGMSEKRISCILDGEILESSSESDVESNDCDSEDKNRTSETSSDGSDDSMESNLRNETESKHRRRDRKKAVAEEGEKPRKTIQNDSNPPAEQGKTLLEILELEMRARAIRALLKQNDISQDGGSEPKISENKENGVKELNDEVVDLTGCEDDEFPEIQKKGATDESMIDEKVSKFEEKIEKSHTEKGSVEHEQEKVKRLQAEFELRNKVFKKKIYRTRQQRMENEEEYKVVDKEEQTESLVAVTEDPEEGELSSSEDDALADVKQTQKESQTEANSPKVVERETSSIESKEDLETKVATKIVASNKEVSESDNLESVKCGSEDTYNKERSEEDLFDKSEYLNLDSEDDVLNIDSHDNMGSLSEESQQLDNAEETSWRERWLRKDGVQKLVKSSKIYAKVKKRIAEKSQRSKEEFSVSAETKPDLNKTMNLQVIEGSIKEYEKLVGKVIQPSENSPSKESTHEFNECDIERKKDNV